MIYTSASVSPFISHPLELSELIHVGYVFPSTSLKLPSNVCLSYSLISRALDYVISACSFISIPSTGAIGNNRAEEYAPNLFLLRSSAFWPSPSLDPNSFALLHGTWACLPCCFSLIHQSFHHKQGSVSYQYSSATQPSHLLDSNSFSVFHWLISQWLSIVVGSPRASASL